MTEYNSHRIRFIDYVPSGISCLAIEDVPDNPRLAVVRENGTIELWHIHFGRLIPSTSIPRLNEKYSEKAVWCNGRLISYGVSGEIIEWSDKTLSPVIVTDSQGGAVWSAAVSHSKESLAVGCEDGVLRLFDVQLGVLDFYKGLAKQESRIMAVAWSPEDMVIAAGCANGTICLYNAESGRITTRMTCEHERSKGIIIWALTITKDMLLISTNSIGETQFWDINTGTLYQSFNSHQADVLTLCLTSNEDVLFTSGVDSKVIQFSRIQNPDGYVEWKQMKKVLSTHHDIRSLVVTQGDHSQLISGGVEPRLFQYFYKGRVLRRRQDLPFTPFRSPFSLAKEAHILAFQEDARLHLWHLPEARNSNRTTGPSPIKLVEIASSNSEQIISSDISDDGRFVAFGTRKQLKCCYLQLTSDKESKRTIHIGKLKCSIPLPGIQCLAFGKNQLAVFNTDGLTVLNCLENRLKVSGTCKYSSIPEFNPPCCITTCSQDGKYCAAVDSSSNIHVFSLQGGFSPYRLPSLSCCVTGIAFKPKSTYLFWTCSSRHIHVYNVLKQRFLKWSTRACELRILEHILVPEHYFTHISFSPTHENEVYLHNHAGLVKIDLNIDLPGELPEEEVHRYYRKHRIFRHNAFITEKGEKIVSASLHYDRVCLLHSDFCNDGSIVIVEKAIRNFFDPLPPPLYVRKFGY